MGFELIRTIWIATFGLALLNGLFATKVAFAPPSDRSDGGGFPVGGGERLCSPIRRINLRRSKVNQRGTLNEVQQQHAMVCVSGYDLGHRSSELVRSELLSQPLRAFFELRRKVLGKYPLPKPLVSKAEGACGQFAGDTRL